MKKIILVCFVVLLIAGGYWLYTGSSYSDALQKTISTNSPSQFIEKVGYPKQEIQEKTDVYLIDIVYPQTGFSAIDDVLNDALLAEADQLKELALDSEDFISEFGVPYSLLGDYEVTRDDNVLLSLRLDLSLYTGGAHGNASTWTFVFDKQKDNLLSLADLFKSNSGYLSFFSDASIEDLSQREMFDNLEWLREGAGPRAENFRNFVLTENQFVIIFDAYQVGPYAAGSPEVLLNLHLLRDLLNPDYTDL